MIRLKNWSVFGIGVPFQELELYIPHLQGFAYGHPRFEDACGKCEHLKNHREYLQSQRKFAEGETITEFDELLKQELVMWNHSTRHIEAIKNLQLSTILKCLERGVFRKAIRKNVEPAEIGESEEQKWRQQQKRNSS